MIYEFPLWELDEYKILDYLRRNGIATSVDEILTRKLIVTTTSEIPLRVLKNIKNNNLVGRIIIIREEFEDLVARVSNPRQLFSEEQLKTAVEVEDSNPIYDGISYIATSEYLFKCGNCQNLLKDGNQGFNEGTPWYELILATIGGRPALQKGITIEDLTNGFNDSNLTKKAKDDITNYSGSGATYVQGTGYICDHCIRYSLVKKK